MYREDEEIMNNGFGVERPLRGWVIIEHGGVARVGHALGRQLPVNEPFLSLDPIVLSPVYDLHVQVDQQEANGKLGLRVAYSAAPVLMLGSIQAAPFPAGSIVFPCDALSLEEAQDLAQAIEHPTRGGRHIAERLRARSAKIKLATEIPRG